MTKSVYYTSIIGLIVFLGVVSTVSPNWLNDKNRFLESLVTHELLNILGVILAITLASISSLLLQFKKMEEEQGVAWLINTRKGLKQAAYWLIGLFLFATIILIVKPLLNGNAITEAYMNSIALIILYWHALVLLENMRLVFAIKANLPN